MMFTLYRMLDNISDKIEEHRQCNTLIEATTILTTWVTLYPTNKIFLRYNSTAPIPKKEET